MVDKTSYKLNYWRENIPQQHWLLWDCKIKEYNSTSANIKRRSFQQQSISLVDSLYFLLHKGPCLQHHIFA